MRGEYNDRKMSTASIRQRQDFNGVALNNCLHPQMYIIEIEINNPEGKRVCTAQVSYDQFVQLLLFNGNVTVTLAQYRDTEGNLVSEEVQKPESVGDKFLKEIDGSFDALMTRLTDASRDLYEMVNAGKAGKTALKELKRDIDTIREHLRSNTSYYIERAAERVTEIQENAKSQLSIFANQALGANLTPEQLTPLLETKSQLALPEKHDSAPVQDVYEAKEREQKPLEKMTAIEIADEINMKFKAIERAENKERDGRKSSAGDRKHLYMASAWENRGKVYMRYINYHGETRVDDLEQARAYLNFLRGLKRVSEFKTFYWFQNKS